MHGTDAPVMSLGSEGLNWFVVQGREAPTFLELGLWTPDAIMSLGFDVGRWERDVDFTDEGLVFCRELDVLSLALSTRTSSKSS